MHKTYRIYPNKPIGRPGYNRLFEASDNKGCNLVVKVIPVQSEDERKKAARSIQIQHLAARYNLAPPIYETFHCSDMMEYPEVYNSPLYRDYLEGIPVVFVFMAKEELSTIRQVYEKKDISQDICDRLMASIKRLHEVGIYHADLHSENVLFDEKSRRVVFIDFDESYFIPEELSPEMRDKLISLDHYTLFSNLERHPVKTIQFVTCCQISSEIRQVLSLQNFQKIQERVENPKITLLQEK